jgi:hypothetical protein
MCRIRAADILYHSADHVGREVAKDSGLGNVDLPKGLGRLSYHGRGLGYLQL